MKWDQKFRDIPFKTMAKNIIRTKWTSKWRTLRRNTTWLNKNKAEEIDWSLTFKSLTPSKITSSLTNQGDSIERTFRMKTWIQELPTMDKLNTRNPKLYPSPNCIICNRQIETDLHPFICGTGSNRLQQKLIFFLTEECAARAQGNKQSEIIQDQWTNTQIFSKYNQETEAWHHVEWKDIIRGAITHKMVQTATKITNNSSSAKEAILKAMERFWEEKKQVWKLRCDITINWEKEQGITKREKRKKNPTKPQLIRNPQKNNTPNLVKYLKNKFKILYIELTNLSITNTLTNSYFLDNNFTINISASGVLTR
jgi:hypothetical protein